MEKLTKQEFVFDKLQVDVLMSVPALAELDLKTIANAQATASAAANAMSR